MSFKRKKKDNMTAGHSLSAWSLVSGSGTTYPLPTATVFLGRDDMCDISLESRSVSEHHALLNYDQRDGKFRIKDLNSINGTYVNDSRIPEQEFFSLDNRDTIRLGYDPTIFRMDHNDPTEDSSSDLVSDLPTFDPSENSGLAVNSHSKVDNQIHTVDNQIHTVDNQIHTVDNQIHTVDSQIHSSVTVDSQSIVATAAEGQNVVSSSSAAVLSSSSASSSTSMSSAWTPREEAALSLAECTGCIAEQGLHHTCSGTDGATSQHHHACSGTDGATSQHHHACTHTAPASQPQRSSWSDAGHYRQYEYPPGYGVPPGEYVYSVDPPGGEGAPAVHVVRHIYHAAPLHPLARYPGHHPTEHHLVHAIPPNAVYPPPPGYVAYPGAEPYMFPRILPKNVHGNTPTDSGSVVHATTDSESVVSDSVAQSHSSSSLRSSQQLSESQTAIYNELSSSLSSSTLLITEALKSSTVDLSSTSSYHHHSEQTKHSEQNNNTTKSVIDAPSHRQEPPERDTTTKSAKRDTTTAKRDSLEPTRDTGPSPVDLIPRSKSPGTTDRSLDTTEGEKRIVSPDTSEKPLPDPESSPSHLSSPRHNKQGTPLYGGLPLWWGEEDADHYTYPHTSTLTERDSNDERKTSVVDRPSTLTFDINLNPSNPNSPHKPTATTTTMSSSSSSSENIRNQTYMEIPVDKPVPNGAHTPPERDPGPGSDPALNKSNMAFTVDFGADEGAGTSTKSAIGEFLPPGLRRSFRQREKEIKDKQEIRKEEMKDQPNGDPVSPARRRKADQWSGRSSVTRKGSLSPRRSGYHSEGHHSNLSSDNEDLSCRSETNTRRSKRIRESGRSVSVTEKSSKVVSRVSTARTTKSTAVLDASRRTPTSGVKSARKTPVDHRKTPTESRKTPDSRKAQQARKTPTDHSQKTPTMSRKTPTMSRKTPTNQNRKTPTKDKKWKSGAPPVGVAPSETSAFLIQKMFGSQQGANSGSDADSGEFKVYRERALASKQVIKPKASLALPPKHSKRKPPEDDVLSEAGTYTIQADKKQKEIEDARRSIDKVFGVSQDDGYDHVVSDPDFSPEDLPVDPVPLILPEMADSMDPIVGSLTLRGDEVDSQDGSQGEDGQSKEGLWRSSNLNKSMSSVDADSRGSSPKQSLLARRSGSSRRILPTPPVKVSTAGNTLANSLDFEATETHVDTDSPSGRHRATVTFDSGTGGTFTISFDAPQRDPRASGEEDESGAENSKSAEINSADRNGHFTDLPSPGGGQKKKIVIVNDGSQQHLPPVSREDLLIPIDTTDSEDSASVGPASAPAVVMQSPAMKKRSPRGPPPAVVAPPVSLDNKHKYGRSQSVGSDRLKAQQSPRSPRAKSSVNTTSNTMQRASSVTRTSSTTRRSTSRTRGSSLTRDLSTSESESASIISSDYSESMASPKLSRSASAGKGPIAMPKTNKTFALRRQRTTEESDSSTLTPRSSRPSSTTDSSQKSPRVSSTSRSQSRSRSTSRSRSVSAQDARRTDTGLGQRIVDKSRENARLSSSTGAKDIKNKSKSGQSSSYASPRGGQTKPVDARPRSGSSRHSSTSGKSSQPSSRTSSPKTDEYNAWKRRKSYDPRQAVAEAQKKKTSRSRSQLDDTCQSVSSLSSDDSSHHSRSKADPSTKKSRTDDIIKLSTEIYQNLAAMSKDTDNEEAAILLYQESYSETETVQTRFSSDYSRSAFSSVAPKKPSPPIVIDSSPSSTPPTPKINGKNAPLSQAEELSDDEVDDDDESDNAEPKSPQMSPRSKAESYNTIILKSVHEISNRVKARTDALMNKLQTSHDLRSSPFLDDLQLDKETPGLLELGGVLTNLRTTEKHLQMIDSALFPGPKSTGPVCDQRHLEALEEIRSKMADFRPIQQPAVTEPPKRRWGQRMHKQPSQDSDRSDAFQGDDYW